MFLLLLILTVPALAQEEKESLLEKITRYHDLIESLVQGSLDSRGLSVQSLLRPNVASYSSIQRNIDNQLLTSRCASTDCENYAEDFAATVESPIGKADHFEMLPNVESFIKRKELFENAKKTIYILVWATYDDETGKQFRDQMLNAIKRNSDLDIRIIVDGAIVNVKGKKTLKEIDKGSGGKIKIMKWKSRKYRASGNHRKLMIIDSEHVIVGGMNFGNPYSHLGKDKWRDLDMYIGGPSAAMNAENLFKQIWNRELQEYPRLKKNLDEMAPSEVPHTDNGQHVVFVDQHPGSAVKDAYHHIHTAIVKLFRDAKETIDIENAYFIMDPIIRKELSAVLKRGVKVRLFTNSDKSVDENIITMPIMHSARDVMGMGAQVWLRKGTTLHSKYMVVDGKISMIGSFNFHPRSLRFDAENVAVIFDKNVATELTNHFNEAVERETYVDDPKRFKIPWHLMGFLTQSFYFDFL